VGKKVTAKKVLHTEAYSKTAKCNRQESGADAAAEILFVRMGFLNESKQH
jgi:hypothetical protein